MSNSPPPTVLRGWEWTQHALWREDVKCNVRMVDTVFFDQQTNRPSRWLFASKHGTISKKKDDHLTYDSIRDRFLRLSAHPQNTNKFVAYCLYRNGNRKLLNAAQFDDLINALDAPRASSKAPSILGFQGYVVGRTDPPITLVATVKSGQCVVVAVHQHTGEGIDHVVSLRLRKEVEQATTDITQFLRQAAHVAVVKLTAEFVEADENVLWLVHVPNAAVQSDDDLMRFMGMTAHNPLATAPTLDSLQDQQHEAAFLAELAKHSTPQEGSPRNSPPEDEVDNVPLPAIAKEPLTRSFTKKSSKKDHRSNHQPVLAQFEHEWNQVDHANRSLMQENQALRDRLHQIETQYRVEKKQSKQLGKRIASMQKEFADAMAEKDDMVRRQLVEADQRYNQQLLERLANTYSIELVYKGGDQLSLIETIEHLTGQLEKEQRDHELDAHKMQAQHQDDVARIYDRHKMETEALRISNQLQVAHSQNKQAKATLHDVQHQKIDLEEQVVTLEKKLQASVSSADARAAAATDQASLEKLQHKIDYLKAQLASEIRCKEELGSNVATLTVNIDALKKDRKKILVEADDR
ncbi:hypothetical protein DYB32_003064 [Aphanomyces invadans]|uniref:Uncharacterized protein n=1 Tax=Aphanomyces invadans TaxID=157072 RepID=A0A418B1P1_9STRA|nr:hypothetical protein DYB32_003064 [Aphanomyces invadans]